MNTEKEQWDWIMWRLGGIEEILWMVSKKREDNSNVAAVLADELGKCFLQLDEMGRKMFPEGAARRRIPESVDGCIG